MIHKNSKIKLQQKQISTFTSVLNLKNNRYISENLIIFPLSVFNEFNENERSVLVPVIQAWELPVT